MNVNAIKLGKYTALGALGGLTGIYATRKHAEKVNLQQENDSFELTQAKTGKKNIAGRLLGAAVAAMATVALSKTPAGKKALEKAKSVIKPLAEKFKASKFGQKIFKGATKVQHKATNVVDKVAPQIEKVKAGIKKDIQKLAGSTKVNKAHEYLNGLVEKFKTNEVGKKAIDSVKSFLAKIKKA